MRVIKAYYVVTGQECLPLNPHQLRWTDVIAIGRRICARVSALDHGLHRFSAGLVELAYKNAATLIRIRGLAMLPQLIVEGEWYC
jgi:hypothetical protein